MLDVWLVVLSSSCPTLFLTHGDLIARGWLMVIQIYMTLLVLAVAPEHDTNVDTGGAALSVDSSSVL